MLLSLGIFILTIAGIVLRPWRVPEAAVAVIGAATMIVLGDLTLPEAGGALSGSLNVLAFFLGLMLVAAIAESAGLFDRIVDTAVKHARGSGRRLLIIVFAAGTVITVLLSNDATALMLTPVVIVLVVRLKLNPLPYVFACAFIANAASVLLPVANPVNLLAVDAFDLRLGDYLAHLLLPGLAVISITIGLFLFIFRRELRAAFPDGADGGLMPMAPHNRMLRPVAITLVFIVLGYLWFSLNGWPLSIPVIGGAAALLLMGLIFNGPGWGELRRSVSWSILPFIGGLAVLVRGLESGGVIDKLSQGLVSLLNHGELSASVAASAGTAAGANLMNNWPAMMVSVSTLAGAEGALSANPGLPYQVILGAGLGPNIAIFGSFSTMLWLVLLRRRGLQVKPMNYFKLGLIVTPPALLAGSLILYRLS
ncbi:SLC13 family permease [Dehalogenimonas sp. THU2]|uniref:SLC13 family permease n=1 Tax=Dehalogenimonas sp. THU2 TaxID=3151121 RepID=UPI0032181E4E